MLKSDILFKDWNYTKNLASCLLWTGIGDFVQGEREGIGRCTYVDGGKYEGQWKADKRHGTGTMKYYNGDVYVGDWSDDTRQGRGTCKFADGTRFQGRLDISLLLCSYS